MAPSKLNKAVKKVNIIAVKNGQIVGYIKSISVKTGKFSITTDKQYAKGYTSKDAVHYDIDFLAKHNTSNYMFVYE